MKNFHKILLSFIFVTLFCLTNATSVFAFPTNYHINEPYGGMEFHVGDSLTINWDIADPDSMYFYNQDTAYTFLVDLYLWDYTEGEWVQIGDSISSFQGSYSWYIPMDLTGDYFRVKLVDRNFDGEFYTISQDFFSFIPALPPPPVAMSLADLKREDEIIIYPNPTSSNSIVTIDFAGKLLSEQFSLRILDALGKSIIDPMNFANHKSSQLNIPINNIPSGVYFIEISDGKNMIFKKLLIMPN